MFLIPKRARRLRVCRHCTYDVVRGYTLEYYIIDDTHLGRSWTHRLGETRWRLVRVLEPPIGFWHGQCGKVLFPVARSFLLCHIFTRYQGDFDLCGSRLSHRLRCLTLIHRRCVFLTMMITRPREKGACQGYLSLPELKITLETFHLAFSADHRPLCHHVHVGFTGS